MKHKPKFKITNANTHMYTKFCQGNNQMDADVTDCINESRKIVFWSNVFFKPLVAESEILCILSI